MSKMGENLLKRCEEFSLFFGSGEKNTEAFLFMRQSGLFCRYNPGSTEEGTPILLAGCEKIQGLQDIKEYIEVYKARHQQ